MMPSRMIKFYPSKLRFKKPQDPLGWRCRGLMVFSVLTMLPGKIPAAGTYSYSHLVVGQTESKSLWGLLEQGGWAMYPLALCSLALFFLIIYGWRETSRRKFLPDPVIDPLCELLRVRNLSEAGKTLGQHPSVLSRCLQAALGRARTDLPDANRKCANCITP